MSLGTPLPPMRGQAPIGQGQMPAGGQGQKPLTPAMGGQAESGMEGTSGPAMGGSVSGGMAGQYQTQGMSGQSGQVDYASRQRQLLNTHLQAQGQMAMQASTSSSGGFFSKIFGGGPKASAAPAQQSVQAAQSGGLLSTLGFGRNPQAMGSPAATKSYAARRHDAYADYKKQSFERTKMEKDISRRQRLSEGAKSSTMQRYHTSRLNKMQKTFEKGEKAFKKSSIGYKYIK